MNKKSMKVWVMSACFMVALFSAGYIHKVENNGTPISASQVSAGAFHTCALTTEGAVKCWGSNDSGELGNGATSASNKAVEVRGLESGVKAISAGFAHTCAVTDVGAVKCWGADDAGQLGHGGAGASEAQGDVAGLASGVKTVSAGAWHTCAVTAQGSAKCWGANDEGQLGNGATIRSNLPVTVTGLSSGVAAISAGASHTCALTSAGAVKCWGDNADGQLGNGGQGDYSNVPVDVAGLGYDVKAISASGEHTCALTSSGGVKCWGWNPDGRFGDGATIQTRPIPVDVAGLSTGARAIASGWAANCALTSQGAVECWGDNHFGELGNTGSMRSDIPEKVAGLTDGVKSVSAGASHTCALTNRGEIKCWGYNSNGQLGNGTNRNSSVPAEVVYP